MKNLEILNESILKGCGNPTPRIAIVGNSGVTKEESAIIEKCDLFVRFNNYATRGKIEKTNDPFLCDILFTTFDLHSDGSKPKHVVIGIPFPFKAESIAEKPQRWYPNSKLWMVNPYHNMELCKELKLKSNGSQHPLPSIGLTALWHMRNWKAEFFVAGFEWYHDGGVKFQNWDLTNKNYPLCWNHNYPKEVKWILENLYKKNNFIFSANCKRILNIAQLITKWGM